MATSLPTSNTATSDIQSELTAARPKGKWATPEEWMAVKPIIRRLYLDDNVPLKDVMTIMETQHDFHGTVKMYKNKLNEWGFFKTYKPREVLDALRTLEARKAAGEDHPTLNMRGIEVDIGWIRDYIKRNRKRINKITRAQAAQAVVASSTSSSASPPPTILATTGVIRLAEELLSTMNLYVDNAMTCGLWYIDSIGFYRSKKGNTGTYFLYDFWDRLDEASHAMAKSQQIDLINLLNPAFARLNDIVREEDPRSFPFLLGCFEVLRLRGRSDLIETFLKYIWQLSSTLLGPTYPHSQIWKQAYHMFRTETQGELIEQVFMLLMDRYHRQGTKQMTAAQALLGGGVESPYKIKCTSGLHVAYKTCLKNLELTIKSQLEQLEADENAHLLRRTGSPSSLPTATPTPTITGPLLPNPHELRNQIAQLRADHTAGILGLLRSAGQYREAQEALDVLAPITSTDPPYPPLPPSFSDIRSPSPSPSTTSTNREKNHRRQKQPDKLATLVSLVESKLANGDTPSSAEHLERLVEHLVDNPSVYRDEGWINWIFEGLVSVPSLTGVNTYTGTPKSTGPGTSSSIARQRLRLVREATPPPPPVPDATGTENRNRNRYNAEMEGQILRGAVNRYLQKAEKTLDALAPFAKEKNPNVPTWVPAFDSDITVPTLTVSGSTSAPDMVPDNSISTLVNALDAGASRLRVLQNMTNCAIAGELQGGCPQGLPVQAGSGCPNGLLPAGGVGCPNANITTNAMGIACGSAGTGTCTGGDDLPPPGYEGLRIEGTRTTAIPLDKVYAMENTCRGGWESLARAT